MAQSRTPDLALTNTCIQNNISTGIVLSWQHHYLCFIMNVTKFWDLSHPWWVRHTSNHLDQNFLYIENVCMHDLLGFWPCSALTRGLRILSPACETTQCIQDYTESFTSMVIRCHQKLSRMIVRAPHLLCGLAVHNMRILWIYPRVRLTHSVFIFFLQALQFRLHRSLRSQDMNTSNAHVWIHLYLALLLPLMMVLHRHIVPQFSRPSSVSYHFFILPTIQLIFPGIHYLVHRCVLLIVQIEKAKLPISVLSGLHISLSLVLTVTVRIHKENLVIREDATFLPTW